MEEKKNIGTAEAEENLEKISGGGFEPEERNAVCQNCMARISMEEYFANNGLCSNCRNLRF